ncbi:transcription initiation factor TFIID subunit 8 isoform X3 [Phyllopteryx taeniolatus]|uniref:transcription initiation factor TFIID subunit 8 isoform X3 n=1 Tax=Phyllopteryx taeniolatus TaxID=161469 RepID=UPI002AD3FD5E|nr:transcription initiation factor TFIID subunit 8 isoform X3 [Phyllopteryx taeniolatus]
MADPAVATGASLAVGGRAGGNKAANSPVENYQLARRRTLQVVVSALLTECGFDCAEKAAVETLTEMMQSYITEIGRCTKSYCEHTARSVPTLSDTVVTLIEMGFNVDTLPIYAKRSQRMVITAPPVTNHPMTPKALSAGQKRTHPPHIPGHYPEFPDPHTYIKTPTFREPVSDYQVVREKAATQRRDVERALTRFMAKTSKTQSLFKDDIATFPRRPGGGQRERHASSRRRHHVHERQRGQRDRQPVLAASQEAQSEEEEMSLSHTGCGQAFR